MSVVNSTGSGAATIAATQISQRIVPTAMVADSETSTDALRIRGAPKVTTQVTQTVGAVAGLANVQTSISDTAANTREWLTIDTFLLPLGVSITRENVIPGKFVRIRVVAPAANGITFNAAIMTSQ